MRDTDSAAEPRLFGALLARLRAGQGWSQHQLAAHAGYDSRYVARLEAGKREPSRETVGALAGLLDCDADETVQLFVAAGFLPPGRWVVRQGVVMLDGDA